MCGRQRGREEERRRRRKKCKNYEYAADKWYCDFDIIKTGDDCLSVRSFFFNNGFGFGQVLEDVLQAIRDEIGNLSLAQLDGLTVTARDKIIGYIDEWIGW